MFHQLYVDCGKEFYLIPGIQEQFAGLKSCKDVLPYKQTQSKKVI